MDPWKLNVLLPIPFSLLPITLFMLMISRNLTPLLLTSSTENESFFSQASICNWVSQSINQSSTHFLLGKKVCFFRCFTSSSRIFLPFLQRKAAAQLRTSPVYSWPISLPFITPLLNLVRGKDLSLCLCNNQPTWVAHSLNFCPKMPFPVWLNMFSLV